MAARSAGSVGSEVDQEARKRYVLGRIVDGPGRRRVWQGGSGNPVLDVGGQPLEPAKRQVVYGPLLPDMEQFLQAGGAWGGATGAGGGLLASLTLVTFRLASPSLTWTVRRLFVPDGLRSSSPRYNEDSTHNMKPNATGGHDEGL